jgi:GNAT superfamily N-acetyltransferase
VSPAWVPRLLEPQDRESVLALERLTYGADAEVAQPAFYDWLYRQNPSGEARIWHASTPDGQSAGQFVLVPLRFRAAGAAGRAGLALNVVTHPAYRRQGVFAALCRAATAEAESGGMLFDWALPNPNSCPGFLDRAGYVELGRVPLLLCPLDPDRLEHGRGLHRIAVRFGARLLRFAGGFGARPVPANVHVEEVGAGWDGWDLLWQRLQDKYPVMVVRDRSHLLWRLGECPTRRYRLYVARVSGEPAGYIATRQATVAGLPAGLVVDLLTAPGEHREAGAALLARARKEFQDAGTPLAAALMLRHTQEYASLRSAGFFPCPRFLEPQPFRVVFRSPSPSPARELRAWFLSMADYDVV